MSRHVPILFRDLLRPFRHMENEMRMLETELMRPGSFFNRPRYFLKYPELEQTSVAQLKDKFQVKLDVEGFKPAELKVKTLTDQNTIEIEGKHEEREDDHGLISRQFVRRFVLPKGHDLKGIVSTLSEDGILTITAPKKPLEVAEEKVIPVEHITEGDQK